MIVDLHIARAIRFSASGFAVLEAAQSPLWLDWILLMAPAVAIVLTSTADDERVLRHQLVALCQGFIITRLRSVQQGVA